jgi:hypothetical protein
MKSSTDRADEGTDIDHGAAPGKDMREAVGGGHDQREERNR